MSTLKTGALRGTSGTADSIQLHASNQSVTFPGAVTITGALTSSTTSLGGKIKQILFDTSDTEVDTNSGSFVDAGLEKAITPTSNTSNILIFVHIPCSANRSDHSGVTEIGGALTVYRKVDSGSYTDEWSTMAGRSNSDDHIQTNFVSKQNGVDSNSDHQMQGTPVLFGLDLAPGSGNTFTYKVQGKALAQTDNFRMCSDPAIGYLVLIEYEP